MHDPMTVAFQIPNPFAKQYDWGTKWQDRPTLITIWDAYPEKDGSDDSLRLVPAAANAGRTRVGEGDHHQSRRQHSPLVHRQGRR